MSKGIPNKRYTPDFKKPVVATIRKESLRYKEAARRFGGSYDSRAKWERIYLEEGPEGLDLERRGPSTQAPQGD